MPIALDRDNWESWLDREQTDPSAAASLLEPIDSNLWMERRVTNRVNSVRNNDASLQDPAQDQAQLRLLTPDP
jgi:putative SOS response-associated peptidase YedK